MQDFSQRVGDLNVTPQEPRGLRILDGRPSVGEDLRRSPELYGRCPPAKVLAQYVRCAALRTSGPGIFDALSLGRQAHAFRARRAAPHAQRDPRKQGRADRGGGCRLREHGRSSTNSGKLWLGPLADRCRPCPSHRVSRLS